MILNKRINIIRQLGNLDCAAACLTMIVNYYGYKCSISEISSELNIGRDGVTLKQIKDLAYSLDFEFKAYHYDFKNKDKVLDNYLPIILISKQNHYAILEKVSKDNFIIIDPEKGRVKLAQKEFSDIYTDIVVRIYPQNGNRMHRSKTNPHKSLTLNLDKTKILIAALCMILSQFITLLVPQIIQNILDSLNSKSNIFDSRKILISIIAIAISYFIVNFIRRRVLLIAQNQIYKDLVQKMSSKIFGMDMKFFESHSTGDIINRFNNINVINDFVARVILSLGIDLITGLICFVVMLTRSAILTLFVLILAFIQGAIIFTINRTIKIKTNEYYFEQSKLQGSLVDVFSNILQIQSMGMGSIMLNFVKNKYDDLLELYKSKSKSSDLLDCFISSISIITSLIIYFLGYHIVANGEITIGQLVAFITLASFFVNPIGQLALILPQTNIVIETLNRIKEIMFTKEKKSHGNVTITKVNKIELKNVSYSYLEEKNIGIHDISFSINRGEKIAIVGPSGSGKTTLIKAIMNIFDDYKGEIKVNDIDVKKIDSKIILDKISVVTQIPFIINDTIRKNVDIFGTKTDQEIFEVLKTVNFYNEVSSFPLGLNTLMGENGQNISGGQKQKIAIARALIKEPEIIIFDEASSNLDPISEKQIYNNIRELNLIQIVITHRLTSIKDSDYIYVMQDGQIVESGTHSALYNNKSLYYEMCKA